MEDTTYIFVTLVIVFVISQSTIPFSGVPIAVSALCVIGYMAFRHYQTPIKKSNVGDHIISSDTYLAAILTDIAKYKSIEIGTHDTILSDVKKFYKIYSKILVGKLDPLMYMSTLIDLRASILNNLASLDLQLTTTNDSHDLTRIILGIQSSTYKCMNILKNKYNVDTYVSPIPNPNRSVYELY
jgi:hypothetical protein